MKAHKYWSLGTLACMAGCFYTGFKKLQPAHKYFAYGSLACMGMAIYSGHKIAPKKKKRKKSNYIRASPSLCTYTAVRDFYFHYKLYRTNRTYFMASIMSLIPTFMPSSKAVFSHAQHTLPC